MAVRIQNDVFGRMVHAALYARMVKFAQEYSPELPAEGIVNGWLTSVYAGNPAFHILVNHDEQYRIYEHCVIEVVHSYGHNIVVCHQVQHDKPNANTFDEGDEYIKKLCQAVNATSAVLFMHKHTKAMEKKYGYKATRTVLVWQPHTENDEEVS